jgi:hypothetical protein
MSSGASIQAIQNKDIDWVSVMGRVQKYSRDIVKRLHVSTLDPDDVAGQFYIKLLRSNFNPAISEYRYLYVGLYRQVLHHLNSKKPKKFFPIDMVSSVHCIHSLDHVGCLEIEDIMGKVRNRVFNKDKVVVLGGVTYALDYHSILRLFSLQYSRVEVQALFGISSKTMTYILKRLRIAIHKVEPSYFLRKSVVVGEN